MDILWCMNSNEKDQGLKTALFLMRAEAPKFCNVAKQKWSSL